MDLSATDFGIFAASREIAVDLNLVVPSNIPPDLAMAG